MSIDNKIIALIVKLNRLTSQEQIEWSVSEPPRTLLRGSDDYIPLFAIANFKNQRFAIYENRYQAFNAETEQHYWTDRIVLALLDSQDRVLWDHREFSSVLLDLYETVRRQISGIDSVIDDLLSDRNES